MLLTALAALVVLLANHSRSLAEVPEVPPEKLGLSAKQLAYIDEQVAKEIEAKHLPGCVVAIGRTGGIGLLKAYGHRQLEPDKEKMTTDTIFDMASLTKGTATATSIMILVERGEVRLRNPIAEYIPEFAANGKEKITVEDLLVHRGGLIPDNPISDFNDGEEKAWEHIFDLKPDRPGERFVYSDVGYMVLGEVVHRVSGKTVAEFAAENIYKPLGMKDTGYTPDKSLWKRVAPTEKREKDDDEWIRGEVHDPRAYALSGVAGHAGLFSCAKDLAIYCDALLRGSRPGGESPKIMSRATLAEMIRPRDVNGNRRGLGWDIRSSYSSNRGELFSDRAFGHGGFTGTSMWIDPDLDLFVIFLSNRLHPDGKGSVNPLAGRIGTIAAASIVGSNPPPSKGVGPNEHGRPKSPERSAVVRRAATRGGIHDSFSNVNSRRDAKTHFTGIDVLHRDNFRQLKGRHVGLITNHTGLARDGKRTIDLLKDADGVKLVALFSPEHGIVGALDRDGIANTKDEATGLPVYSLYGETRKPTKEQLKDIDTLVFDIQDVGARFYTYMSTMAWAMEAAAENDLHYVVLDRPNPIGGVAVAGPVADKDRESFVGFHTLPVRHGMTVGELAKMYRAEKKLNVDLDVIQCESWRRGEYWDATGLMWVNPSPNMRSLTEAVLYPGIGLLETTNISVGRGTDTPFEVLGAPWIDAKELAARLNAAGLAGVSFVPIEFTPTSSKYANEQCRGVNITVVDRNAIQPVAVGLQIAVTLHKLYPDKWELTAMDRLLINKEVLAAIGDGDGLQDLQELYQPKLDDFLKRREKYLLYRE
jgi:uncharacterized protein YbbC (DUF1343 family)/CubicO group peptidase (beta-lactamase class C family)